MNFFARIAAIACCFCLCGGAAVIAHLSNAENGSCENQLALPGGSDPVGDYLRVASGSAPRFDFSQLEAVVLRDPTVRSHRARIEFGSVKIEQGNALMEVLFFSRDGQMQPYLYKLTSEKKSWKVASVQRMWYVPRSHLLRGVRA